MSSNVFRAGAAVALLAGLNLAAAPVQADPSVEVMHFWTTGGEAAALGTVRDKVVAEGVQWEDAPVAGGGGDQAKTAMQARIAAGNPPTAMLMLGQNIIDWANEGLLSNVDAVAEREGWDAVLSDAVKAFTRIDGHYVSAPTNVHRTDMLWVSVEAFETIGADMPRTWDELNALARASAKPASFRSPMAGRPGRKPICSKPSRWVSAAPISTARHWSTSTRQPFARIPWSPSLPNWPNCAA